MNYNYLIRNNDETNSLFSPEEGYNLGNIFSNLYNQYKNYRPTKLVGKTEKERDFLDLSRVSFAMHEMNLYLDLHPEDRKIQRLFNDYRKMFIEQEKKYEEKYGPISIYSNTLEKSPFAWVKDTWPWEGDMNNV